MPLPKRTIEPVHIARSTLPDDFPLPFELEAVNNGTLANTIRQMSSLSRHAEDLFGELTRDVQQLCDRSNALQARIDRLAIKVTQLDSTVEEVSLQDIHMRKAFKSAIVFDQQVFSRATMPTAMLETYQSCDKPPPLDKLNCYRDDGKDGLKFYTDPNYFFELWRQEMLNDTERMMHDRGKRPHRPRPSDTNGGEEGSGRHKKRVRQPHNTRERQKQIAMGHGEYIMNSGSPVNNNNNTTSNGIIYRSPPLNHYATSVGVLQTDDYNNMMNRPARPNSIEVRRSYQQEAPDGVAPILNYAQGPMSSESLYQHSGGGTPTRTNSTKVRPTHPPPAPPTGTTPTHTPTKHRNAQQMIGGRDNLPPPPPPPPPIECITNNNNGSSSGMTSPIPPPPNTATIVNGGGIYHHNSRPISPMTDLPPPPPVPLNDASSPPPPPPPLPPPPPPPPMLPLMDDGFVEHHLMATSPPPPIQQMQNGDVVNSILLSSPKLSAVVKKHLPPHILNGGGAADPRNDLLKAIRDGIKLRKVENSAQKEVEKGGANGLHDVASILARRVAVEFSESESDSESENDSETGWAENETSA